MDILTTILSYMDIPAVVLLLMLFGAWRIVLAAQKREDFDFGNMLKGESGKESALRLGILICIAVSSWFIIYDTIKNKAGNPTLFFIYITIWSGAKVAERFIDSSLAKGAIPMPPMPPVTSPKE